MKYMAEGLGTFFLVAVVVGSGIMAENLAGGNTAIALLGNTIATGAILFVIIKMFSSISGAHFNPIISFVFFLRGELDRKSFIFYSMIHFISAIFAVMIIHYIFQINIMQISDNHRGTFPLLVSEVIATFGLVSTILFVRKSDPASVAVGVALFITAGYWFTSSTSFANPAVTIARVLTNTFTGIDFNSALYFIAGQFLGSFLAYLNFNLFED